MSLFDDVIVNAAAAVDTVGRVANEVVDRSRVRVSSAELKNKINSQFETLGRYIYDTNLAGSTDQNVVDEYVSNITVLINELKSLQDSLTAECGRIICPKCGCKNLVDSLFCRKCGASLDFANSYTSAAKANVTLEKAEEPVKDEPAAESEPVAEAEPAKEEPAGEDTAE